jgi:hypothetical protein
VELHAQARQLAEHGAETVGFILVAIFADAIVPGRVYRPTLSGRNRGRDESAESGDSPDQQQRD